MRIAITGATGLLGRNLLFEILKQNLSNLDDLTIFVLGRSEKEHTLRERIKEILIKDGFNYLNINENEKEEKLKEFENTIVPILFDLSREKLNLRNNDFEKLKKKKIDFFFHVAALTDFRNTPSAIKGLDEINIRGTNRLLELISALKIEEIIYVGTAYSCGSATGLVKPNYVNLDEQFRNYYEKTKLIAEINFRNHAQRERMKYRVFRPLGICGRLIERPMGAICKYDIFYGWAIFFLKQKYKKYKTFDGIYNKTYKLPIRIWINFNSGLNVVPADYAAKIMYAVCFNKDSDSSYHLVNDVEIPHRVHVKIILDSMGIEGYNLVGGDPEGKNELEKLYYKTVGAIFTPYVISDSVEYDIENIKLVRRKINLDCPKMTKNNFVKLINYAKDHYFGLVEFKHKKESRLK